MNAALRPRPGSTPQRSSGYTDPAFARIAELAHLFAGLVFPPNRQPSAEAGMRRAMSVLHVSRPAELLRVFEHPGEAREAVLAELTIGESYFFRDSGQLELIVTDVLPPRRETYGPARPLCIWSAGCAAGEEPYTIALMLREQGWPHPAQIIATDIAQPRLAAARLARYTRWALRGVSDERIARWFTHSGNYYDLDPTVREMVEFRRLNLIVDDYPVAARADGFDVVLCRNVMIYLDLPTVAHIAAGLLASLAPDGWLLLGASDPPLAHLVPCQSIMTAAGVAYRRADAPSDADGHSPLSAGALRFDRGVSGLHLTGLPSAVAPWTAPDAAPAPDTLAFHSVDVEPADSRLGTAEPPAIEAVGEPTATVVNVPVKTAALDTLEDAYKRADYRDAENVAMTLVASPEQGVPRAWILYVRSVANQGRLNEAGELCARALELHPMAAELHVLHATLLLEAGWFGDAASAARRSIYLDRTLVMGHMLLGDALARGGDPAGARVAFTNALHLLVKLDPDATVPAADGVHASRLRQIAASRAGSAAVPAS